MVVWLAGKILPGIHIVRLWQKIRLMDVQPWIIMKVSWVISKLNCTSHWRSGTWTQPIFQSSKLKVLFVAYYSRVVYLTKDTRCQSVANNFPPKLPIIGVSEIPLVSPWTSLYPGLVDWNQDTINFNIYFCCILFLGGLLCWNNLPRDPHFQSVVTNMTNERSTLRFSEGPLGGSWTILSSPLVDWNI